MTNSKYKRPESILLVIYTNAGDVLLLRRRTPPVGVWQSVTGSLQWGERPMDAACRELLEETGLDAPEKPVATGVTNRFEIVPEARHLYAPGVSENIETVYTLCMDAVPTVFIHAKEHSEYCWLPISEAIHKVWSWSNKQAIQAIQDARQS